VAKSCVSRGFVRASAADVKTLAERRFDSERFAVVIIDGVEYAGETMVVTLGIAEDGTKHILGLRQGATENAQVCSAPGRPAGPGPRHGPTDALRARWREGPARGGDAGLGPERRDPAVPGAHHPDAIAEWRTTIVVPFVRIPPRSLPRE
jgi:hypothetical protein